MGRRHDGGQRERHHGAKARGRASVSVNLDIRTTLQGAQGPIYCRAQRAADGQEASFEWEGCARGEKLSEDTGERTTVAPTPTAAGDGPGLAPSQQRASWQSCPVRQCQEPKRNPSPRHSPARQEIPSLSESSANHSATMLKRCCGSRGDLLTYTPATAVHVAMPDV